MEKYNIVNINKPGYPRVNAIIEKSIHDYDEKYVCCKGCSYNHGTCGRLIIIGLTTLCSLINDAASASASIMYKCILRSITLYSIINSEFTKDGNNDKGG